MEKTSKELLKEFVNSQHFASTTDIMNSMKELFSDVLQTVMEAELEEKLGYEKSERASDITEKGMSKYNQRFERTIEYLGLKHKPHETRHTFITRAKEAGVDEYCLKPIVGHQIGDVTEKVYTHRTLENLKQEIEKIA